MSRTSGITGKTLNNSFALGREIHENRVIGYLNRSPCFCDLFVRFVFGNIGQLTIKDAAKHIKRIGANTAVLSQPVKLSGADFVVLYQLILRNILFT